MTEKSPRICILGGGFGGLYTALRLSQLPWEKDQKPEITLVDRHDRFLFTPLLYELITGELQTWEIAPPFSEILANTNIRFERGVADKIDLEAKTVYLGDRPSIFYDYLVMALGGETPLDLVPGAKEYTLPFRSLTDVYLLEERLRVLEASVTDKIRVAVVGGGYSGVELSCKIADRIGKRSRIRIIEQASQILQTSSVFNRTAAEQALSERQVWLDLETQVQEITSDSISLSYKGQVDTIPVDLVLWTVGTRVSPLVRSLPLKQNQKGQLITTTTLQTAENPRIFALGDLAECYDASGQQVPGTAQVALQQSDYVAWNIWAQISNRPLLPFRYVNLGEMMTLGKDNATLSGLGVQLKGSVAQTIRRLTYLYRMPNTNHQLKVGFNWVNQPFLELLRF
ncbi:NAD(P)/FAD-dependent oxidoreductase [Merismopedia glauca]|uniref:demethylphylloquinone reductase n=1 Tax=Merismopedia glauca CCAP 1448/3 TaxID=1296344 RepID=A0A2T1C7H9_9CYAN|nr:NAD(P)/FAD-dependent oxidoreductase [Merismopedia glauca]PSB04209.1 FAD-dependent oxidoreductase [Merismopedia glauca CCAP 1448/3]